MKKRFLVVLIFILSFNCYFFLDVNASGYYDKVYYITDNPNYQSTLNYLKNNNHTYYNNADFVVEYYNNSNDDSLYLIENIYLNYDYLSIEDSCIIFECNYMFNIRNYNDINVFDVSFGDYNYMLTDIFSTLKSNENMVCFICATDQNRFYYETSFLQYVDFHIDTDMLYLFISNTIYRCETSNGNTLENYSLMLNKGIYDWNVCSNLEDSAVIKNFIAPYLDYHFGSGCYSYSALFSSAALHDLHIYFNYNNLVYREYDYNQISPGYNDVIDLNYPDYPPTDYSFIGSSYGVLTDTTDYLDIIKAYKLNYSLTVDEYFYTEYNINMANYINSTFYFTLYFAFSSPSIEEMLIDFIDGNNVSYHDNWAGICAITHKMVNLGANGWMLDLGYCPYWDLDYVMFNQ